MRPLYEITAPDFVAGIELAEVSDRVVKAAPIVKYMEGWPLSHLIEYCARRGWKLERVA